MKHFKKIFAVALACVMMLTVLTGCGKSVKDYQNELNGKLGEANIGISVNDEMNQKAETIAKSINKIAGEVVKGNDDYEKIIKDVLKEANVSDNTKCCISMSVGSKVVNVGMDGSQSSSTAPATDFFVQELKAYNEAHPDAKLTKAGVGLWKISLYDVNVVILLAE